MSWRIGVYSNDLFISDACAADLFELGTAEELWYSPHEVRDTNGTLGFNEDHMEHMDYLCRSDIQNVLRKHKVNGTVTFHSTEGDNAGSAWGYRFEDGKLTELVGELVFREVHND